MFASASYPAPSPEEVEAFVRGQFCGKVVAIDADGYPQVSLLPFRKDGDVIEVHMVQADPTFVALQGNPSGAFVVDEALAFTPHTAVAERYATYATLHFRAVLFRIRAEIRTGVDEVAGALERLLGVYEPDERWLPVADGPDYGQHLRRLAVARLHVVGVEAKFKLAQNRTPAERERLLAYLSARGLPGDPLAVERIAAAAAGASGGRTAEAD